MNDFETKRQKALDACEKAIEGTEDGIINVSALLLLCRKIARLVNDIEGQEWLEYEYSGYPKTKDGYIPSDAFELGRKHGRVVFFKEDENESIFTELASELEESVDSMKSAIHNYTTHGFSVSGEHALVSTERMTLRVSQNTNVLLHAISKRERQLSILKSQYYDYAAKWQIELLFGNTSKGIFDEYREAVDQYFTRLPAVTLQKMNAIENMIEDGNPERYAQVLTSCRRLWSDTAKYLFDEVLPDYSEKTFRTLSGKNIDISGDHFNNKLSAVIETLQSKATSNTLIGSNTIYLIDWLEQINSRQSAGVHSDVSRDEAIQCVIHTYIALGDILRLKNDVDKVNQDITNP